MSKKFGLCKRCKKQPAPIVPRRRVLAAALMCQVAGFTLMTIGFFTPGWKLQSFRQRTEHKGLWFDMICWKNKSCTVNQNVYDFSLTDCRMEAIIGLVCVVVTMGIVPQLRPTSDNALKAITALYNLISVPMTLLACISDLEWSDGFLYSRFMFGFGGVFIFVTTVLIVISLVTMFSSPERRPRESLDSDDDDDDDTTNTEIQSRVNV